MSRNRLLFHFASLMVASHCLIFSTRLTAQDDEAQSPSEILRPLEVDDLRHFTTWLRNSRTEDPEQVFRIDRGILRCGDEDIGYVATRQRFKNYRLSVEYRWGRKNPKDLYVRNSGLLLHGTGKDGSQKGVWMKSIECQLAQGCEGDLIVIPGNAAEEERSKATLKSLTVLGEDGKTRWNPQGAMTTYKGKQFWWSKHQPFFQEAIDTRGENDLASPLGEWTRVEIVCQGDKIAVRINGELVNEAFEVQPSSGKILLQAEGHEVFFRNLEIAPL